MSKCHVHGVAPCYECPRETIPKKDYDIRVPRECNKCNEIHYPHCEGCDSCNAYRKILEPKD